MMHPLPARPQLATLNAPDLISMVPTEPPDPWSRFGERMRRRRGLFLTVFLAFVGLVIFTTIITPRTYTTQVKLIAGSPGSSTAAASTQGNTNLPVLNALLSTNGVQSAETYAELVQETPVAQRVIDDLKLGVSVPVLMRNVTVKPITNTSIIGLSATWRDARTSANIANAFAQAFVTRERDLIASQANSAVAFLQAQIPAVEVRMRNDQAALTRFQATHHIADITAQTTSAVNAVAAVESKIAQAQLDRNQADAQTKVLSAQLAKMSSTTSGGGSTIPNPVVAQLRTQLAQAEVQLSAARQQYTDNHPTVTALKEQTRQLQQQISQQPATIVSNVMTVANPVYQQISQQLAAVRASDAGAQSQLVQLQRQRAAMAPMIASLPAQGAQLATLQRKAKLAEDLYNALQQKLNDATVMQTSAISDVTITQPADPASASVKPNWALNFGLAIFLGLLLASTTVLVMEYFDQRIRSRADVDHGLSLPVLALIPKLDGSEGKETDGSCEAFLELVTQVRYTAENPYRSIAITSPNKGDGKSTIATNVAIALGELATGNRTALPAARVLLIDADLRRPSLHHRLALQNELGLSDILIGRARFEEAVQRSSHPGVDVLTSGTASRNPIKLLQSESFDQVLELAKERYATVIIDAPAALPVIDAAILGAKANATIMVVSSGTTDVKSAKRALQRLQSVGVREFIGIVLNRAKRPAVEDYSDYFAVASAGTQISAIPPSGGTAALADSA